MFSRLIPVVAILALAAPAFGDNKIDAKKLKGAWEREESGTKITFDFKDEKKVMCIIKTGDAAQGIEFTCDYSLKGNVLSGEIKSVDKKGSDAQVPGEGTKFTFKIEIGEKKATFSDAKVHDEDNPLINGEYTKK